MGSAFVVGGASHGVIPSAMDTIFAKIKAARNLEFTVRVGFVEILTVRLHSYWQYFQRWTNRYLVSVPADAPDLSLTVLPNTLCGVLMPFTSGIGLT